MALAVVSALALLGLELARAGNDAPTPAAVRLIAGVPVGVRDTPGGALAAADGYLSLASQTVEAQPATFATLVAHAYASSLQVQTLAEARRLRELDRQDMANYAMGGRGLAIVAARRLDSYSSTSATVTSWLGGFVWGPHLAPRQTWSLVDTRLAWRSGRWLVLSSTTQPTPAPVPSVVYVDGANDRSPAFARLAGMTSPSYGAPGE